MHGRSVGGGIKSYFTACSSSRKRKSLWSVKMVKIQWKFCFTGSRLRNSGTTATTPVHHKPLPLFSVSCLLQHQRAFYSQTTTKTATTAMPGKKASQGKVSVHYCCSFGHWTRQLNENKTWVHTNIQHYSILFHFTLNLTSVSLSSLHCSSLKLTNLMKCTFFKFI